MGTDDIPHAGTEEICMGTGILYTGIVYTGWLKQIYKTVDIDSI